eukprot:1160192-Pelagomonas_calceolata.AAC.1
MSPLLHGMHIPCTYLTHSPPCTNLHPNLPYRDLAAAPKHPHALGVKVPLSHRGGWVVWRGHEVHRACAIGGSAAQRGGGCPAPGVSFASTVSAAVGAAAIPTAAAATAAAAPGEDGVCSSSSICVGQRLAAAAAAARKEVCSSICLGQRRVHTPAAHLKGYD